MNQTAAQLRSELSVLEAKTARIRRMLERIEVSPEAKTLATAIHAAECTFDHTEHCGWQWERDNWKNGYAHREYLKKAKDILNTKGLLEALADVNINVNA